MSNTKYKNDCWKYQVQMFNDADNNNNNNKIYYVSKYSWNKKFSVNSYNYCYDINQLISKDKKNYNYELLREGNQCKPYIDYEYIYNDKKKLSQSYIKKELKKICGDIKNVFKVNYNYDLTKKEIFITNCSRFKKIMIKDGHTVERFKISYHIVISTKKKHVFENNEKKENGAYHFAKKLLETDTKYYNDKIDMKVYTKNRLMRLIFSGKDYNDDQKLIPISLNAIEIEKDINYEKYLITNIHDEYNIIKTPEEYNKNLKVNKIIKRNLKQNNNNLNIDVTKKQIRILNMVKQYHKTAYIDSYNNEFININYKDRTELCPICDALHDRLGLYVYSDKNNCLKMCCRSSKSIAKENIELKLNNINIEKKNYEKDAVFIEKKYLIDLINKNGNYDYRKFKPSEKILKGVNLNDNDKVIKIFDDFIKDNSIKSIGIKAIMGCGKTVLTKNFIKYCQNDLKNIEIKRILNITHRQTLSHNIYGNFKDLGFRSYMDIELINKALSKLNDYSKLNYYMNEILNIKWSDYDSSNKKIIKILNDIVPKKELDNIKKILKKTDFETLPKKKYQYKLNEIDRLICSVESLPKLISNNELEKYDLIILDEVESIINQFSSPTVKDKRNNFKLILDILNDANKIIALDADFSNRSYKFLSYFGNLKMLINKNQKKKSSWIFDNNKNEFIEKIKNSITMGKKIVIASLSQTFLKEIVDIIEEINKITKNNKIKYLLHSADQSDSKKEFLKDVNKYWSNYDVVMYSPQIESGVDFNIKYFDEIYACVCPKSATARGFKQMLGRIRNPKNKNINIYFNNYMKCTLDAPIYNYKEILKISKYLNKFKEIEYETFKFDNIRYRFPKFGLYEELLTYNELEKINSDETNFLTYLRSITQNNIIFDLTNTIKKKNKSKNKKENKKIIKENIFSDKNDMIKKAPIINEDIARDIDKCIKNNQATHLMKAKIVKYNWMKKLGIKKLFIDEHDLKKYDDDTQLKINKLSSDIIKKWGYYDIPKIFNFELLLSDNNFKEKELTENMSFEQIANIKNNDTKFKLLYKKKVINNLIKLIGFKDISDVQTNIYEKQFYENMEKVYKESLLFKDKQNEIIFNFKSNIDENEIKEKGVMVKKINEILKDYSIKITSKTHKIKNNKKNKKKTVNILSYNLIYKNNILPILHNLRENGKKIYDDFNIIDNHKNTNNKYELLRYHNIDCVF